MKFWIIHELNNTSIDLLGTTYDELNELAKDDIVSSWHNQYSHIIMTDISFNNYKIMHDLLVAFSESFIWIDHHEQAILESYKRKFDIANGLRDLNNSSILNMYKYLFTPFDISTTNAQTPELLKILSAWDSFTYKQAGYDKAFVRKVNMGAELEYSLNVDSWLAILNFILYKKDGEWKYDSVFDQSEISNLCHKGDTLFQYDQLKCEKLIKEYAETDWTVDERKALALYMQGSSNSDMFSSADSAFQNGIVFKRIPNGKWSISLYNIDDNDMSFNCSEYLKQKYGGGGHFGAAGCIISDAQFRKAIKLRKL